MAESRSEIECLGASHLEDGWEGSMVKNQCDRYKWGRGDAVLKYKPVETGDATIESSIESEKFPGELAAWRVTTERGGRCKVGGGLSKAQRRDFWERRAEMVGVVIEVEFKEWTLPEKVKFREPVFKCVREDR
jgi:ATP-dependent DNA ligase